MTIPQKPQAQTQRITATSSRQLNPTLAQTGGLPPIREGKPNRRTTAPAVMQHSRAITRKSASNLALAFVLLPRAKRDAMSALYAFCREVDDVADEESVPAEKRREQLAAWRDDMRLRLRKPIAAVSRQPRIPARHPEIQPAL